MNDFYGQHDDDYGSDWEQLSEYEYDPCDSENETREYYDVLTHASDILDDDVIGRDVTRSVKQLIGSGWSKCAINEFLQYLYKRESQRFQGMELCIDMPICENPENPLDQMEKIEELIKIYT